MSTVAVVLLGTFVVLILLGVPIYLSLGLSSLIAIVLFDLVPLEVLPGTVKSSFNSFTLLAIPFFMLAGNLLAGSEIAVRLIDLARALVGAVRGGLAIVASMTGVFFGGISGSGPAEVSAQGTILIPALERHHYPREFASALVAASGAIGIVIPPSIALIIYGVVANASIGRLFMAGVIPGVLFGVSLAVVSVYLARRHGWGTEAPSAPRRRAGSERPDGPGDHPLPAGPSVASAVTVEPSVEAPAALDEPAVEPVRVAMGARVRLIARATRRAIWGLLAPVIILAGLRGGVFTPTEAAAVIVVYALFVSMVIYRDIGFRDLGAILVSSARMSGVVMIIIASASIFAFLLNTEGIARDVASLFADVAPNAVVALLMVNVILLVAGMLLDAVSIYFIFIPILLPVVTGLGVDPVHFGIVMTVNLAVGQITPPVGVNLFVAAAIGRVSLEQISRAVLPLVAAEIVALLIITFVPALSLWLPDLLGT